MIDDDPAAVEGMRALFSTWGAEIAGGAHADAVLAALGEVERYPDLIVADLRLADGTSGLAAIARLRDELGEQVPALVVSGDLGAGAARDVREAGFVLLPKPVVPASLEAAPRGADRRRRAARAASEPGSAARDARDGTGACGAQGRARDLERKTLGHLRDAIRCAQVHAAPGGSARAGPPQSRQPRSGKAARAAGKITARRSPPAEESCGPAPALQAGGRGNAGPRSRRGIVATVRLRRAGAAGRGGPEV